MSRGISPKTKKMTTAALLSAMGVVILFLGSLIETLDLSMAALASFLCIFAVIELGGCYPWLTYAVTGLLAVILMPQSMAGWFYLGFFGYYAIVKEKTEKLKKPIAWLIKILLFNVALFLGVMATYFLFFGKGGDFSEVFAFTFGGKGAGIWFAVGIYLLANVVLVVYDIALTRLITFYLVKLRHRFKFLNLF